MTTQHTPEPWELDSDGRIWSRAEGGTAFSLVSTGHYNARRIVACVNGCHGIEDPERDIPELVAALRAFSDAHSATGEYNAHTAEHGMVELVGMARTILSRLEKGAQQE